MIYISSACVKSNDLKEVVSFLHHKGFRHIELSGGTERFDGLEEYLIAAQEEQGIHFLCHNYFPPPRENFVLNFASTDSFIHAASLKLVESALALSQKLGAKRYAFHAGFYMDIAVNEVGKPLRNAGMVDTHEAMERFCDSFKTIKQSTEDVELYLENNVVSEANYKIYGKKNPFMMTTFEEYEQLRKKIDFKPLVDVGHLKVSCNSLGLDFEKELTAFAEASDYHHISDNDGKSDSNQALVESSELYRQLKKIRLKEKTVSLEIYDNINAVAESHRLIKGLME